MTACEHRWSTVAGVGLVCEACLEPWPGTTLPSPPSPLPPSSHPRQRYVRDLLRALREMDDG